MGDVIQLTSIAPKQERFRINNLHDVKLTFLPGAPANAQWQWEVTVWQSYYYSGTTNNIANARSHARAVVDKMVGEAVNE